jgi:hypothetical protein
MGKGEIGGELLRVVARRGGQARRILVSDGVAFAHLGGIAVNGDAAGSPRHLIGVLVCGGGAAGRFDSTENGWAQIGQGLRVEIGEASGRG